MPTLSSTVLPSFPDFFALVHPTLDLFSESSVLLHSNPSPLASKDYVMAVMNLVKYAFILFSIPGAALAFTGKKNRPFYAVTMGFFSCHLIMIFPTIMWSIVLLHNGIFPNYISNLTFSMSVSVCGALLSLYHWQSAIYIGGAGLGAFSGLFIGLELAEATSSYTVFLSTGLICIGAGLAFAHFQPDISVLVSSAIIGTFRMEPALIYFCDINELELAVRIRRSLLVMICGIAFISQVYLGALKPDLDTEKRSKQFSSEPSGPVRA